MAIIGHWKTLAEAQKLVQDKLLISGVIETIIEEGQLLPKLPIFAIDSKSILYNREKSLPSAAFYAIGDQIPWLAAVDYDQVELSLTRVALAEVLDNFMLKTYKNPNDYRAQILRELTKGSLRTIEDSIIYGDVAVSNQFSGLHKIAAAGSAYNATSAGGSGALSLAQLRLAIDSVKPKPDLALMPFELQRRIDAAMWEAGLSANSIIRVATDAAGLGGRVTYFEGTPIVPSDYLVAETSLGAKYVSGTKYYTVFLVRLGQLLEGGICMAVGGETGGPDFFRVIELDELEDYDAAGIRLVAYCALAMGSTKALARIYGITDVAIVA